MSKREKLIRRQEKLEAKLEKKSLQLKEAISRLRGLETVLAGGGLSPFAPERFPDLPTISGVRLASAECGVRYEGRLDVMLADVDPAPGRGAVAGVFTRSKTRAAPVLWCEERLAALLAEPALTEPVAILVNAGNANAFTGDNGCRGVEQAVSAVSEALGRAKERVLMASTGVIGEPLPADRIAENASALAESLAADQAAWDGAAQAIMTTDTFPKGASTEVQIGDRTATIAGIAKGSGMIAPDMGTMLAFVFTDAALAPDLLQRLTSDIADGTFNCVTVDGDTSTSDTLIVAATGRSDAPLLETPRSEGYAAFRRGLERVMRDLAQQLAKDGEGASKFVEVRVEGAKTRKAARTIGLAIANSPLVKTAWAGEDPNWGRIVMAVGKSGEEADRDKLTIRYGPHTVAEAGWRAPDYDENTVAAYMTNDELVVTVDVGVGPGAARIWTCDLTHQYVTINADYRS